MERIYRQLWNEAGEIKGERYSQRLSEYRNGTITLKKGILQPPEGEKNAHTYYTFEIKESILFNDELKEALLELVTGALGELLKKNGYKKGDKTLCVGLGNEKMTADSLGAITVNNLHITRHIIDGSPLKALSKMHNLSAIKSSVSGVTGLNSYDIINGVIQKTTPDFVIAVDTLACKSVRRLGRAVQLSDEGIQPGGGVNNPKQKLDIQSLGIPVIALGAPLVIYAKDIIREYIEGNKVKIKADEFLHALIVTAKEIDIIVEDYGVLMAAAINRALSRA